MDAMVKQRRNGFTLIELMITVAVIAILATIAYPSYTSYIRKGKRATAQAALMDAAAKQQTYLLDRRAYTATVADTGFTMPSEIQGSYTISVACAATGCADGFTATATPTGSQAVPGEQTLTLDNFGAKSPANKPGYWGK